MRDKLKESLLKLTTIDSSFGMTTEQEEILEILDTLISNHLIDDIVEGLPEDVDDVVDVIIGGNDKYDPLEHRKINEIVEVMERWQ